jgi:hypothetical protein
MPGGALFVFIGATGWLGGEVALDADGFARTGPEAVHAAGTGDTADGPTGDALSGSRSRWRPAGPARSRSATSAADR